MTTQTIEPPAEKFAIIPHPTANPLPCPFCGIPGELIRNPEDSLRFYPESFLVGCFNTDCPVLPSVLGISEAEVIASWNTRPRKGSRQ